ncbi:MAG: hypothetical protein ACJLTB_23435 [Algoriphagus aquaeductus]|uniref:hypothetical protein n=1 Tax=Algoriphagus aquaeductus TaxID=475299 RepID=UPI0038793C08
MVGTAIAIFTFSLFRLKEKSCRALETRQEQLRRIYEISIKGNSPITHLKHLKIKLKKSFCVFGLRASDQKSKEICRQPE